jgi:DNA repair protein RadD
MANHEQRWYQREAVGSLFEFFRENPGYDAAGQPIEANPLICMPTGTGKSHVIGDFTKEAMHKYPQTRVIMATHVKELVQQNARKLQEAWPLAPLGIYSAGLKSRDFMQPIIFGGVQSMVKKVEIFGRRDLLIIDEAHLLSPSADTSYQHLIGKPGISGLRKLSPYLKVIGLTATRWRMGLGCLTNGNIFTNIAYDICTIDGFNRLIAEGYLATLIPKRTRTELDISNVGMSNGEYKTGELQDAVDKSEVTYQALQELCEEGVNRASWLVFASGVVHAEHIGEMLNNAFGIPTCVIHSKKSDEENSKSLVDWKAGKYRCAVNMNALTTGVDHPAMDLIGMLRPTMSSGLWVQMLGRGTRPFPGKANCLVLDFAGNTRRLGPINDPVIPRPRGEGPPGDAPVKTCPSCGTYNHTTAKICIVCGYEFPKQENINPYADTAELLRSDLPQIEPFTVTHMVLTPHTSPASGKHSIKLSYYCAGIVPRTFYEYKSVESISKFFRHKSRDWFRQVYTGYASGEHQFNLDEWDEDVPFTNAKVIELSQQGLIRHPTTIHVWMNREKPEILRYEF